MTRFRISGNDAEAYEVYLDGRRIERVFEAIIGPRGAVVMIADQKVKRGCVEILDRRTGRIHR